MYNSTQGSNFRKHGVRFADAVSALEDERAISIRDEQPRGKAVSMRKAMKKEYDFSKGKRGPVVKVPPDKIRVTIRLDKDILDWFRQQVDDAGGGNYQTLINDALRGFVQGKRETLENTLRKIIRDELRRAG